MREKQPTVYILTNRRNGTLYTGVTSDLVRRVWEHKHDSTAGFSKKYGTHMLVYFELCDSMESAISREKQLKAGSRAKKLALIVAMNPGWDDLYPQII